MELRSTAGEQSKKHDQKIGAVNPGMLHSNEVFNDIGGRYLSGQRLRTIGQ